MRLDEKWEVKVGDDQYQTDFETLKSWIREGRINPTDHVRKGKLDWAKVSVVPQLRGVTKDEALVAQIATQRLRREIPSVPVGEKTCEACAEEIRAGALKCRYCGHLSIDHNWRDFYQAQMAKTGAARDAYRAAMKDSERDYLKRVDEFLDSGSTSELKDPSGKIDHSALLGYWYSTSDAPKLWKTICAQSEQQAKGLINRSLPPDVSLSGFGSLPVGKFSCPRCGNRYTTSKRDIGCAIIIIIFISLGLGLIMIPFLPHTCRCAACDYRWKT